MENPFRNHQAGSYSQQFIIRPNICNAQFLLRPQKQGPECVSTRAVCYSLTHGALECSATKTDSADRSMSSAKSVTAKSVTVIKPH